MYKNKTHEQKSWAFSSYGSREASGAVRGWIVDHYTHFTGEEMKV